MEAQNIEAVHQLMFVISGHGSDVVSSSTRARRIMKQLVDASDDTADTSCPK